MYPLDTPWDVAKERSIARIGCLKLSGSFRRVLIVDGNVDSAVSLARLLESFGHSAEVAHDGHAALNSAQTFQPDAVILDIEMPEMDGYETARQLRMRYGPSILPLGGHNRQSAELSSRDRDVVRFQAAAWLRSETSVADWAACCIGTPGTSRALQCHSHANQRPPERKGFLCRADGARLCGRNH